MRRFNLLAVAILVLCAFVVPRVASAQSTEECEEWANPSDDIPICEAIKAAAAESHFSVIELPDASAPLRLRGGEAFLLHQECRASKAGLSCSAWPQEVKSRGHLRYQWSFESRNTRVDYPESDVPTSSLVCKTRGWIMAKLTISNGKYRASSTEPYYCGE